MNDAVSLEEECPASPVDDGSDAHECMRDEARCVYCGRRVFCRCRQCGKFLTIEEMQDAESGNYRHTGSCP